MRLLQLWLDEVKSNNLDNNKELLPNPAKVKTLAREKFDGSILPEHSEVGIFSKAVT